MTTAHRRASTGAAYCSQTTRVLSMAAVSCRHRAASRCLARFRLTALEPFPVLQPLEEIVGRQWPADVIALRGVAMELRKEVPVSLGLDPFRHDGDLRLASHFD